MKEKMFQLATLAAKNAYAPYSKFYVGACVCAQNGELYSGCNVENAAYGLTLCAESGAISALIAAGQQKIRKVVIVSSADILCPPCGACRQRLFELADGNMAVHLYKMSGEYETLYIEDLLPHPFGSINLEK